MVNMGNFGMVSVSQKLTGTLTQFVLGASRKAQLFTIRAVTKDASILITWFPAPIAKTCNGLTGSLYHPDIAEMVTS